MHDLKELFERSLDNIRPATPPAGQWSGIEQQLAAGYPAGTISPVASSTTTGFYTGLGGGFFAGSLLTMIVVFLVFPQYLSQYLYREVLPISINDASIEEEPMLQQMAWDDDRPELSSESGETLPVVNALPTQAITPKGILTFSSNASLPDFSRFPPPAYPNPSPVFSAELFSTDRGEEPTAGGYKSNQVITLQRDFFSLQSPKLDGLFGNMAINTPDSMLSRASGRKARWHFEPIPYGQNPPARWEAGMTASPWLTSSSYLDGPDEYSVSTDPANGVPFVLGSGETVILTRERALDQNFRKQLTYHQLQLEGARQFGNGLRLGFGLLWENNNRSDLSLVDNLPDLIPDNNYVLLVDEKYGTLHTTLSAQYTFRRRMRLRYFVGMAAIGQVYSNFSSEKLLYTGSTGVLHQQEKIESLNHHFLPVVLLRPQVGLQYQLARQLSLGLQVSYGTNGYGQVPEFGLGGRWTLR